MIFVIDTSTWISLVKYYKPFDINSAIYNFFKQKIVNGEFLILSEVAQECSFVAKSMVTKELDFISDSSLIIKTANLIPDKKFYNLLDNQFCNKQQKRILEDFEIEVLTNNYLQDADSKIILKAIQLKKEQQEVTIVTEETATSNDNKLFKKIPAICNILEIDCIGLPQLIKDFKTEISILIENPRK